jgi:hypothetical protein
MKRLAVLFLLMIISVITLFVTAYFQRDVNTLSMNDPQVVQASIILIVLLFALPVILSFFDNRILRIISSIYQSIFLFGFIILIPTGLLSFSAILVSIVSLLGAVVSAWSILITLPKNLRRTNSKD